jgi:transcriptional regulator with XRE-family HTH domain
MATAKPGKLRQVLAKNVRLYRHTRGLTQEELADKAKLHRTYMGMIERAERNLSVDNIEKIARALGVKPHQLLMDERR